MMTLALDVLIAVLLVATVIYCFLLHRRLGSLRDDQESLEKIVTSLNVAIQQAEHTVSGLRNAAKESGTALQKKINQSREILDELSVIVDSGGHIADRLENRIIGNKPSGATAKESPVLASESEGSSQGGGAKAPTVSPSDTNLLDLLRQTR